MDPSTLQIRKCCKPHFRHSHDNHLMLRAPETSKGLALVSAQASFCPRETAPHGRQTHVWGLLSVIFDGAEEAGESLATNHAGSQENLLRRWQPDSSVKDPSSGLFCKRKREDSSTATQQRAKDMKRSATLLTGDYRNIMVSPRHQRYPKHGTFNVRNVCHMPRL